MKHYTYSHWSRKMLIAGSQWTERDFQGTGGHLSNVIREHLAGKHQELKGSAGNKLAYKAARTCTQHEKLPLLPVATVANCGLPAS